MFLAVLKATLLDDERQIGAKRFFWYAQHDRQLGGESPTTDVHPNAPSKMLSG